MLIDPIATHGRARAGCLAVVDLESGRRWDWAELDAAVNRVAHWLLAELGAASGARVALLARNCAGMLMLQHACIRAGAIFVPLNWRLAAPEIEVLVDDAQPALLFAEAEFDAPGFAGKRLDFSALDLLTGNCPDTQVSLASRQSPDAPSILLYTSGTSGRPKGVMISNSNAFWGATNFILGSDVSNKSVFLCDMPMFHTAGLLAAVGAPVLAGATVLISKGFDPLKTLTRIADPAFGVTHYFSVPQMAQTLWNQPEFRPEMLTGLHLYATGGAPNPAAQIKRFVDAGIPMSDGFGMSETCSNFAMPVVDRGLLVRKAGSCGLPLLSIEARIVDDNNNDVADGETGELWLRGPSITKGYWNQPELSAKAFIDDWFKTGDAAVRDADGFFYLVDRQKDMFISGGENVYPAEVEAAIAEMEGIGECAVVGVPDDRWGEVGCAYVNPASGHQVTAEAVVAHCKARLAGFKVPKIVIIGVDIPRTASGKVQKHILKAMD
jgi:fatty-acyl-CoA synthase